MIFEALIQWLLSRGHLACASEARRYGSIEALQAIKPADDLLPAGAYPWLVLWPSIRAECIEHEALEHAAALSIAARMTMYQDGIACAVGEASKQITAMKLEIDQLRAAIATSNARAEASERRLRERELDMVRQIEKLKSDMPHAEVVDVLGASEHARNALAGQIRRAVDDVVRTFFGAFEGGKIVARETVDPED